MRRDDNPAVQEIDRENAERMFLASFVAGLSGEIGKLTRIQNPQNVNQALTTALTTREALRQEKDAETFFTRFENPVQVSSRGRVRHVQGRAEPKCHACEGRGHFAHECPTRIKRGQTRNSLGRKTLSGCSSRPRSPGDKRVSVRMERGSPAISVEIEGGTKRLVIDTGSSVSILQPGVSRSYMGIAAIKPYEVTGENLDIQGQQRVSFVLGGKRFRHTFLVCPLLTNAHCLLGSDFLDKVSAAIDFDSRELSLGGSKRAPHKRVNRFSKHAVLTVFPNEKLEADKPLQKRREETSPSGRKLDNPPLCKSARSSKSLLVNAAKEVATAPKRRCVVTTKYNREKNSSSLVGTEPTEVPIQGEITAPAISRNRGLHEANKRRQNRGAKIRKFKKGNYVYLCNTATKPGPSNNFYFKWSGPFQVTDKLSDLNYELRGHHEKKFIVHVHRLKLRQSTVNQKPNPVPKWRRKTEH
jgi:hypothetical protein